MTTPKINLLAKTPRGRTWLEVILDLEPSDFHIEDVRGLRQALAQFQNLGSDEIRVVSIARWQPIIVLEMPEPSALRIVRSFKRSAGDLLRAVGALAVCSMRLDAEGARMLSISRPAGVEFLQLGYRWSRALVVTLLWTIAILVGVCLALVGGKVWVP